MSDQAAERIVPTKPWVRVHHDGPDTEQEAGELAKAKYPKQALKVLRYLMRVGGDTDGHGSEAMGVIKDSYAPARNALVCNGFVRNSGTTEINERNRRCIVWVPTELGIAWSEQEQP